MISCLEYHRADDRWKIFGYQTIEKYLQKAVIKGYFHPMVPTDVVEAYRMAEYMMTHAYYHYPLYHEAYSKVLRIIEMAVKLRCGQLGIPLEVAVTRNERTRVNIKALKALMDDIIRSEPQKHLSWGFDVARNLRNSTMHPDIHTYAGAMTQGYIQRSITLLNRLFLPESVFEMFEQHMEQIRLRIASLRNELLVLEHAGRRYLIEGVEVIAAVPIEGKWHYLLIGYPIMMNATTNLQKHSYVLPLVFDVTSLVVTNNGFEAVDEQTKAILVVSQTDHLGNREVYEKYKQELQAEKPEEREMYVHHTRQEVGKKENEFWYTWLWKLTV